MSKHPILSNIPVFKWSK